jgi:hypothetical protein
MDTLFNAELRDKNIESSVQNANNLGLTNDSAITRSEVGDEDTEEQMGRLFLCKDGRIPLAIKKLDTWCNYRVASGRTYYIAE